MLVFNILFSMCIFHLTLISSWVDFIEISSTQISRSFHAHLDLMKQINSNLLALKRVLLMFIAKHYDYESPTQHKSESLAVHTPNYLIHVLGLTMSSRLKRRTLSPPLSLLSPLQLVPLSSRTHPVVPPHENSDPLQTFLTVPMQIYWTPIAHALIQCLCMQCTVFTTKIVVNQIEWLIPNHKIVSNVQRTILLSM